MSENKGKREDIRGRKPFMTGQPDQSRKVIKAEFEVECDRCGHLIHAGEECRVIMNPRRRKAFFVHLCCPTALSVRCFTPPVAPKMQHALVRA